MGWHEGGLAGLAGLGRGYTGDGVSSLSVLCSVETTPIDGLQQTVEN